MLRKSLSLALALAAACGGVQHTNVSKPTSQEVNAEELAKLGRITSLRENGGTLFIGAEKGIAAIDGSGKVLWTLEQPAAMARLHEADADGITITTFNGDGIAEGGAVAHFLIGDLRDEPHFKDQSVGPATRDGKLLFTAPAMKGVTQMSPPAMTKDQIGVSRGRGLFVYSRADGHEIGRSPLLAELLVDKWVLNASFNRPAFLNGAWYGSHLTDFVKADGKGEYQDRTRIWRILPVLGLDNLTIGPVLFKNRLICGNAPYEGDKKAVVFAFDKEGGKDWKEYIDDKASGVGSITANSERLFVATNFHVKAIDEKGSEVWDQVNKKGGLYPSKYRGLKYAKGTN